MRIAIDGRALVGGPRRGIAHYLAALLEAWPPDAGDELRVVLPRGVVTQTTVALPHAVLSPLPSRVLWSAAAMTGRPRLDALAGGCDVAWVPAPAPVAVRGPFVLSVHDRSWEQRPQDFTRYERLWHAAAQPRALARRATRVVTTTRWGRHDLVAAWGLDPQAVTAVHLAPAIVPGTAGPVPAPAAAGPVLFVGALEPRKGPDVLATAVRLARRDGFEREVVVVGGGRCDDLLRVPGVRSVGTLDDAAVSGLHAAAAALVVPSRLEGFGLPALEALAHGTPVVSSDLPPVREVLGDAAAYVPPGDAAALAAALLDLPGRPVAPGPLDGRDWAAVARETRAVLVQAAG